MRQVLTSEIRMLLLRFKENGLSKCKSVRLFIGLGLMLPSHFCHHERTGFAVLMTATQKMLHEVAYLLRQRISLVLGF